jgi:hypothetical protein
VLFPNDTIPAGQALGPVIHVAAMFWLSLFPFATGWMGEQLQPATRAVRSGPADSRDRDYALQQAVIRSQAAESIFGV